MAVYERVTSFLDALGRVPSDGSGNALYWELVRATRDSGILDPDYDLTLDAAGLCGTRVWRANVESLDLRTTVALLTFILEPGDANEDALVASVGSGYLARVLRRLAELDGTLERPRMVTFYHENERDGYLSNWYVSPFEFRGTTYPTGEHWMMCQKAAVFRDYDARYRMLKTSDQGTVKRLGRRVRGYSDAVWESVDQQLMRVGLRQKFVQNERLLNELLSTGSAVLGEAAGSDDPKWGVGLCKGDPDLGNPASWYGSNLLGRTLMDVRSDLRSLCAAGCRLEWSPSDLESSQVWRMSLLELARVPSTRPFALMYATIAAEYVPTHFHGARDVLRKVGTSVCDIDESMRLNMGGGLPIAGWCELLDELALQVRLGRV